MRSYIEDKLKKCNGEVKCARQWEAGVDSIFFILTNTMV